MAGEWQVKRIGDLGQIITGKTPSTKVSEFFDGKHPFITIPDLDGRREIETSERSLSELGAKAIHTTQLPVGAVMMSCIATIGKCGITTRPSFTNQQINSVICNKDVDHKFLYYSFTQLAAALDAAGGGGSVYTNVSKSRFSNIQILLPTIPEQKAIAHILGTLDDKIELNRQMNKTLEEMVRAIFKSWFVDFLPVRAKMAARTQAGGLKPEIAKLFPDSFENSELGEIPTGWKVGTVGNVADHPLRGIKPHEIKSDTPYIALEHMPRNCIALSDWVTAENLESNKFEFKKGEILFGKLRPYFHKVGVAPVNGVCSTDIVVVVGESMKWFGFVLGHISSTEFVEYTNAGSTGTKMPRTSWIEMARYQIVLPPEPLASAFTAFIQPSVERIIANINETITLASLRDVLLPKLISGELRVRDAERFLKERGL
ncbi:MAG: restriction endonuclease subunit S [Smithella sp.]|nr:restriction endonuclease subunit S [Smithella sp.]